MSIIRQRSKNLIFSGLIGFMSGLIVVLLVYMIGIRGNIKVIEWILNDSQLEVMTMSEPVEEPVVIKEKAVVLNTSVTKGTIITEDMLKVVDIESSNLPSSYYQVTKDLIGEKALIDLEALMIVTDGMTEKRNVFQVSYETLEIVSVHYPDILAIGQSINMRIHYPTGQDYTILENKNVVHIDPENKSFFVNLNEEEILSYSSAKEDKNIYPGTELYITIEGRGNVAVDEENGDQLTAYERGLVYDEYPLNPNVLALSQVKNFDAVLLDERVILDLSLKEFFDLNSERFSYEIEVMEAPETTEEGTMDNDNSSDIGVNIEDESMPLQATSVDSVTNESTTDSVISNEEEVIVNEEVVEEDVEETEAEEEQTDFDF